MARNPDAGHESRTDFAFTRTITPDYPTLTYRRRKHEVKTVIHWGQRKLLISEIEFLTLHARPGDIVLYAGAAPGTHTPQLINMFPQLLFVLVDPAPFSGKLREGDRVRLRQECFTDELAREYTGLSERLLFVCDVRSCDPNIMDNEEVERHVWEDMAAQMRWHTIMRPRRSMLKFRLPWQAGTSDYLDGDVYLPVWGPITTTEARLITHENSVATRPYDHTVYEQQMFYFNTRGRVARYRHAVDTTPESAEGLDYCYDCAAEIYILALFLQHGPPSGCGVWAEPAVSAFAAIAPAAPADGSDGSTAAPAARAVTATTEVTPTNGPVTPLVTAATAHIPVPTTAPEGLGDSATRLGCADEGEPPHCSQGERHEVTGFPHVASSSSRHAMISFADMDTGLTREIVPLLSLIGR